MTFVSLTLGVLPVAAYGLGFVDAAILIIVFNFLGSLPVALFSSLGPVFGLRQIPLSRFYFGYHGAKLGMCLSSRFSLHRQPSQPHHSLTTCPWVQQPPS